MTIKQLKAKERNLESGSRQQILDVALKLFAHKGYAAATVREIVDTVGITAPSLYYYFGNKEGLYMELMQTHCARIDQALESHMHTSSSARERLKDLVDKIFLHVANDRDFFRLMFTVYYGPSQGAPYCDFLSYHAKFHAAIKKIIEEGIASGEFKPGNSGYMTWVIRGVVQLAMEEQIKGDRKIIERQTLQKILDLILDLFQQPNGKSKE
ncbi:MAG: HTH-type transcriptional repressor KstR2 [Deltaproteobacteria bacterium ADurb.Bin151]|nr:MAG: HTH-type transcriptional repressor KstR2 [Deltaproteobacteria bacterium ADurb.Bin151]HNZ09869.1 TetR/AcrR family transcriptional regulator [Smithellaceae bacterium]HRY36133.1 TetR/AcrR family transcriptional regulator [Smithellaceae bacterium]